MDLILAKNDTLLGMVYEIGIFMPASYRVVHMIATMIAIARTSVPQEQLQAGILVSFVFHTFLWSGVFLFGRASRYNEYKQIGFPDR